jgi:type II secretory pathway pseudopilin PulG
MTGFGRRRGQGGLSLLEAMAAILVVGLGVSLFVKVQGMSKRGNSTNSKVLVAGKMIENFLEDTRITIARDTAANWPPAGRTVNPTPPHNIKLVSVVSSAYSPKDGAVVGNVRKMDITATWTQPYADTLKVTTYVAKRF